MEATTSDQLVSRYRTNYAIPADYPLTAEMIRQHWNLERQFRQELLSSSAADRWEVFDACYSRLYSEFPWLAMPSLRESSLPADLRYSKWVDLIGPPPQSIYEVGSGTAGMVSYLAGLGYACRATEVTKQRGAKWATTSANLSWGVSDGVHLQDFEAPDAYDVVVSTSVVEHLHPQDLPEHLAGAYAILRRGGRYIVSTQHAAVGPNDVSAVFCRDAPEGMHLKEYSYHELAAAMAEAGFQPVQAAIRLPLRWRRILKRSPGARASRAYLAYLVFLENGIDLLPTRSARRRAARASRLLLFAPNITIVGTKP